MKRITHEQYSLALYQPHQKRISIYIFPMGTRYIMDKIYRHSYCDPKAIQISSDENIPYMAISVGYKDRIRYLPPTYPSSREWNMKMFDNHSIIVHPGTSVISRNGIGVLSKGIKAIPINVDKEPSRTHQYIMSLFPCYDPRRRRFYGEKIQISFVYTPFYIYLSEDHNYEYRASVQPLYNEYKAIRIQGVWPTRPLRWHEVNDMVDKLGIYPFSITEHFHDIDII